jgi:hypothetical protein
MAHAHARAESPSALFTRLDEALDAQSDPPAAVNWPDPTEPQCATAGLSSSVPDSVVHDPAVVRGSPDPAPDAGADTPHSEFPAPNSDPTPHSELPTPNSRRGRPPIFDALKQHTFLRLVAVGFSTRQAAHNVGVSPSTVREKVRTSREFASRYEDSKAQAIPVLAESIYKASQKSWRASAWLLERLQPEQFGRRVALGPDRAKMQEVKRRQKIEEQRRGEENLDDHAVMRFFFRMFNNPVAQASAKKWLRYVLNAQINHDQAVGTVEEVAATGHYDMGDMEPTYDDYLMSAEGSIFSAPNVPPPEDSDKSQADIQSPLDAPAVSAPMVQLSPDPAPNAAKTPHSELRTPNLAHTPHSQWSLPAAAGAPNSPPPGLDPSFYPPALNESPSANNSASPDDVQNSQLQAAQPQLPIDDPPDTPNTCAFTPTRDRDFPYISSQFPIAGRQTGDREVNFSHPTNFLQ